MAKVTVLSQTVYKICRTCMGNVDEQENPQNCLYFNEKPTELYELFSNFTALNVLENDSLPNMMCKNCIQNLRFCASFREQCLETHKNLLRIYNENSSNSMDIEAKKLTCLECKKGFDDSYHYYQHMVEHNKEKSLFDLFVDCNRLDLGDPLCDDEGEDITDLINHLKYSEETKICESTENVENSLQDPKEETYNCTICNRKFSSLTRSVLHFLKHGNSSAEHYHFCSFCGEIFDTDEELENHFHKHFQDKKVAWICLTCSETFKNETALLKHETDSKHQQQLQPTHVICTVCSETFTSVTTLLDHSLEHLLKKYKCPKCTSFFIAEAAFNEHLNTHPEYILTSNPIKTHTIDNKPRNKTYTCSICRYSSTRAWNLRMHLQLHIEGKLNCRKCSMNFKTRKEVTRHKCKEGL